MSDDIVQHLKDDAAGMSKAATEQPDYYAVLGVYAMTCHEAADEIERLRAELDLRVAQVETLESQMADRYNRIDSLRSRLAQLESETDSVRRDLPA